MKPSEPLAPTLKSMRGAIHCIAADTHTPGLVQGGRGDPIGPRRRRARVSACPPSPPGRIAVWGIILRLAPAVPKEGLVSALLTENQCQLPAESEALAGGTLSPLALNVLGLTGRVCFSSRRRESF